jgi:hypothetical protein
VSSLSLSLARGRDFLRRTLLEAEYPLVAVEVRARSLGVVRLEKHGGRTVLAAAASSELPEGLLEPSITQPNFTDREAFSRALTSLLERAGALREGPVALVLPDPVGRIAFMPASELGGRRGSDLKEMARFRLRRTVPFEIREAQVAVGLPPRGGPDVALVAVLYRPVLEAYEEVLLGAGLRPDLVELSSLVLLDLLEPVSGDRLFVNWDEGWASLILAREGWPLLVRTLAAAASGPEALQHEVTNTLLYYRERLGGPGLAGAVVRSAAVPPEEAAALLGEALGLTPTVLDPWTALGGGERGAGQALAGAVAAALRGASRWAA